MKRRTFLAVPSVTAIPLAAAVSGPSAGFAERDITPKIGDEQPGNYYKQFHKSFHDPCKVRAAVFSDGQQRVAIVGVDALIVPRQTVVRARERIEKLTGIRSEFVLIGASHSHSSGPVGMVQPGEYDDAPPFVRELAAKSTAANAEYLTRVEDQIVEAVQAAESGRGSLLCGVGSGREDKAAFNRRFRMKNGQTWTHPRQGNPDIVGPAGPIDPEVGVIGAFDQGQLKGCVVTYACHATTSPGGISANWMYYLEKTIRGVFGSDVVVVFLPGACADITQVDNLSPYREPSGEQYAKLVGGRVGAEAGKVLLSMTPGQLLPIAARSRMFPIQRRRPSATKVAKARVVAAIEPTPQTIADWVFAKETVMVDWHISKWPEIPVEVQAIQIGPAVFAANPAEYFVELGLDIKKRSAFPFTWPVMLANGCVGYVPTEAALGPGGGGYETRLTTYTNLEVRAGTKIADASVNLIASLKPGVTPTPPPAAPFQGPWNYGNVPPETD